MKAARLLLCVTILVAGLFSASSSGISTASPQSKPGDLDLTFDGDGIVTTSGPGTFADARDVATQHDGKILLAGYGDPYLDGFMVARYDDTGALDPTFGDGGISTTLFGTYALGIGIALQDDGRVLVAGWSGTPGNNDFGLVRYLIDGSLDPSFGNGGTVITGGTNLEEAYAVAVQPDGKIVAVGKSFLRNNRLMVARYLTDGTLDPTFGSGGIVIPRIGSDDVANGVAIQPDGGIVVVGSSTNASSGKDLTITRFQTNGTLDTSFSGDGILTVPVAPGDGDDAATDAKIQLDGRIVVVGYASEPFDDWAAVRILADGSLDTTFGGGDGIVITKFEQNNGQPSNVAMASDGKIVVGGSTYGPADFAVVRYQTDGTLDGTFGTDGVVLTAIGDQAYAQGVALAPDGKIVLGGSSGNQFAAARYLVEGLVGTNLAIAATPDRLAQGDVVDLSGTLTFDDGSSAEGKTIHVTRTNPDGSSTPLPDATTDAQDAYAASDAPAEIGTTVYSVRYDGDETHDPAVAAADVEVVTGARSDFNADGYADLAVGVPWEDNRNVTDTGAINVLYGSASGLTSNLDQFWDETSTGVSTNGTADGFGFSSSTGDFNGDGFSDLAASAPGKQVGGATYGGAVVALYGGSAGLATTGSQFWTQDSPDVEGAAATDDFFGWSVAAGDLNGDGFDDLAVGVPGETVGGDEFAGAVNVLYGSVAGLTSTGDQLWNQDSTNINNTAEAGDQFGLAVGIGDFDGNGFHDLAVGVPTEVIDTKIDAGAVNVIYGSAAGLTATDDDFWNQNSEFINDKVETDDWFGYRVASGDFDGDGYGDLIVGVPEENLTGGSNAGAVNIIYGSATGLDAAGDDFWNQDSDGINNSAEANDEFGLAVAAGDFDGDAFDDAAIGIASEDLTGAVDGGAVSVIYGTTGGLDDPGDDFWNQNVSGIEDTAEAADLFGYALVAADFGNGPEDDLAIGVVLEKVGSVQYAGAANVIYGSPSDLTSTGDQFWNQDSTDIEDQAEVDDEFGSGMGQPSSANSSGPSAHRPAWPKLIGPGRLVGRSGIWTAWSHV